MNYCYLTKGFLFVCICMWCCLMQQSITENAERACAFVVPTLKRMLCFLFFSSFNSRGNTCCYVPFKLFFKISTIAHTFFSSSVAMKKLIKMMRRKSLNQNCWLLCRPVQLSCGGDLSKPHECTVPCGEERGRRRLGKEISGRCIQTWNDIVERT